MGTFRVNKKFFPLVEAAKGPHRQHQLGDRMAERSPVQRSVRHEQVRDRGLLVRRSAESSRWSDVKVVTIQPGAFRTSMVEGIERAFTQAESETTKFASVLGTLKGLAAKTSKSAHDPDILAQVVETALSTKRPKAVYSVKPDRARSALEKLPLRAADQVYLTLLKRAYKP